MRPPKKYRRYAHRLLKELAYLGRRRYLRPCGRGWFVVGARS